MASHSLSNKLFERAKRCMPGGVNSPVRAFKGVGGTPVFFEKAEGPYLYDVDGNRYIDYVGSWGPMILGHRHPAVVDTLKKTLDSSITYGAPCELEIQLAEKICELMPSIEMVRMVNSGTEATMTALRIARGFTGRHKVIKFNGQYHGHSDALLAKAGSGALTLGIPASPGVPPQTTEDTLIAEFNDIHSVNALFNTYGNDIAAVILEPISGNMNCIPPEKDFLQQLKTLCEKNGALCIFDEVMTGFRVGLGGAQSLYNIQPDLTTLGKVIGGGMPVGAIGGRKDIMMHLAPAGDIYQAGTLAGNPVAMACGLKTLTLISEASFFENLEKKTATLCQSMQEIANSAGVAFSTQHFGGMFGFFFSEKAPTCFTDVCACNIERFKAFFHAMLEHGVYLAPSAFEAGFVSSAHGDAEIDATLNATTSSLRTKRSTKMQDSIFGRT